MTMGEIRAKVRQRLDDSGAVYSNSEIDAAVNAGTRIFCLLTLCIERQALIPVGSGSRFTQVLTVVPDFLVPLRVELRSGGARFDEVLFDSALFDQGNGAVADTPAASSRLRAAQIGDFHSENGQWLISQGTPKRYAMLGFDLLALDRVPPMPSGLLIKYAAAPTVPDPDFGSPEIPVSHHEDLAAFAPYWLRVREGGSLHTATRDGLNQFLAGAKQLAAYVRARSLAQRYDREPSEFTLADVSRDPATRADLEVEP